MAVAGKLYLAQGNTVRLLIHYWTIVSNLQPIHIWSRLVFITSLICQTFDSQILLNNYLNTVPQPYLVYNAEY